MRWRGLVAGAAVGPLLFVGASACGDDSGSSEQGRWRVQRRLHGERRRGAREPDRNSGGTDPREVEDYYVSHVYVTTGPASVTLTNSWEGIFTYEGINGPATLELEPFTLQDQANFDVIEYDSRLVDS